MIRTLNGEVFSEKTKGLMEFIECLLTTKFSFVKFITTNQGDRKLITINFEINVSFKQYLHKTDHNQSP